MIQHLSVIKEYEQSAVQFTLKHMPTLTYLMYAVCNLLINYIAFFNSVSG